MKATIKQLVENPKNYIQCKMCLNPVNPQLSVCGICGGEYFQSKDLNDFSHYKEEGLADNEIIEF
jgi:hypothetical protein